MPNVRLWRNNRISAMAVGHGGKLRRVDAGIDGQGDLTGIARIEAVPWEHRAYGLKIEIEVKAGKDHMRESQKRFQAMIEEMGGLYLIATDVDQCLTDLRAKLAEF